MKAIVLLSGGLDSRLAIRLLQEQNIELEGVNFVTIFCTCTSKAKGCSEAASAAKELGVPLKVYNATQEIMDIVENPRFGYGNALNPCIDCRIAMFKKAKKHMVESKAEFIVTGEVLGQRPMSQRKDAISRIEKEAGLEGLILRPLSARLLKPTIPEVKGWVDREKLLDIKGRSRQPQMKLAKELNVNNYPCPAGGCLLTEKGFSLKVKDLIKYKQWNLENVMFLKHGRHFRFNENCKAVVGKDKNDNARIKALRKEDDYLLEVVGLPGPSTILKGKPSDDQVDLASKLTAYFVTKRSDGNKIKIEIKKNSHQEIIEVCPLSKDEVLKYRITA